MRLHQTLEKYLPLIGNMLIPAALFAYVLFSYLLQDEFIYDSSLTYHWLFFSLSSVNFIVLLYFNQGRLLFFNTVIVLGYILLNHLKILFGSEYADTPWFENLVFFLFLDMLIFYRVHSRKFLGKTSLLMLVVIILEYTLSEQLSRYGWGISFYYYGIDIYPTILALAVCFMSLYYAIRDGKLTDYNIFFASLCVFCGIAYSENHYGLSLFFALSQIIIGIDIIYNLVYHHYYDGTTELYSRKSYQHQSEHFPQKYCLGIISIDAYDKLQSNLGRKSANSVVKMLARIIAQNNPDDTVYRYDDDEFVVLYKTLDKKETFSRLDEIRRLIAGLSFEYSTSQKPLKLTVSCSVAEKKRSDFNAAEVLARADAAMRKTLKFSHNVTSQG